MELLVAADGSQDHQILKDDECAKDDDQYFETGGMFFFFFLNFFRHFIHGHVFSIGVV